MMPGLYEIRADYDPTTIVVYQAYPTVIAEPALERQRFVAPFSFERMTWIKPSFLWLMHRSNWGQKRGQERTLAVRIALSAWEHALALGVLTSPEPRVHGSAREWKKQFDRARVHVQWDPERSVRGAALTHYSIQVGLSRHVIRSFAEDWIVSISDMSPTVAKIRQLLDSGQAPKASRFLPREKVYIPEPDTARSLLITG